VLVTGGANRSVLAATRALGRAGWEVTVTGPPRAPALLSRYAAHALVLPEPETDAEAFRNGMVRAAEERAFDAILPGTDAALSVLATLRLRFPPTAQRSLPEPELVARCLDRVAVARAAAAADLPEPESAICADAEAACETARELGYPLVAKPVHVVGEERRRSVRRAAVLVRAESDLEPAIAEQGLPVVLQRYARAAVVSAGGVALPGRGLAAVAVSRYARTWPPLAGNAAASETIRPPDELVARLSRFVENLGWHGVFELELLELGRDRFAAIDFNPRVYGSLALAVRAGANLPSIWCEWAATGEAPTGLVTARPGVRYRWEEGELRVLAGSLAAGRLAEASSVLRPRSGTVHAVFDLDDPRPALRTLAQRGAAGFRRLWGGRPMRV
jgi:biotin carboxylase